MSCEEIEGRFLDFQENQLNPALRTEVEIHLAGCAGCRTLARQLQHLDAALSANLKIPALSPGFGQRLAERMQAAPVALSEAERAERKLQLQAEFEAGLARIARRSFALGRIRRHLTWPVVGIAGALLAWRLTPHWAIHLPGQGLGDLPPNLLPWLAASVVILAAGLAEFFPRPWRFFGLW